MSERAPWAGEGLTVEAFYRRCPTRFLESYRAMEELFRNAPGLMASLPRLEEETVLHCFCKTACPDCQIMIPLLDLICRQGSIPLRIHSHKKWAQKLEILAEDPTALTLPTLLATDEEGKPLRCLFGRPGGLDVVTWRTGKGWEDLFAFFGSSPLSDSSGEERGVPEPARRSGASHRIRNQKASE